MTAVDIVYTSCHDAVRNQAGAQGPLEATGDQATKDTPQASGVSYHLQCIVQRWPPLFWCLRFILP